MHSINLYMITRKIQNEVFSLYEKALSDREEEIKYREDEVGMISALVDALALRDAESYCYENWFYSFSVPQIGKEFDLLKIGRNNRVINIELKSQPVSLDRVEKQLKQNRYYLSHITPEPYSYTLMKCDESAYKVYKFENGSLSESSLEELTDIIHYIDDTMVGDIEKLFRPGDYLISPLSTPEKFLEGKYYLNQLQELIKKNILDSFYSSGRTGLWGIKGSAGTGKSLLLYDIAKTLSADFKVGIIHCGFLNEGHKYLNSQVKNLSIIPVKELSAEWLSGQDYVCVDEAQRLYSSNLDKILNSFSEGNLNGCIFSYDPDQVLSAKELESDTVNRLAGLPDFHEEHLVYRVRANREIFSFIRNMMQLGEVPKCPVKYSNVDVLYANDVLEAEQIVDFYRKKEYTPISFIASEYTDNNVDYYVIGQEYDNVLMVIDENFKYNKKGDLEACIHPNPDFLFTKLFYQNATRARERLCIVILNNPEVFETLLKIKENYVTLSLLRKA